MARIARPQKPPIKELDAGHGSVDRIGMIHEKLIGRAVAAWSALEASMELLIWDFLELEMDLGRIITTRLDASSRIQMLRPLAELCLPAAFRDQLIETLNKTDIVREDRNFVVHGQWASILPEFTPIAYSMRVKHDPLRVVGETFDASRMKILIETILQLRAEYRSYLARLPQERVLSPAQLRAQQSTPAPNP